jgi:hypothetical protein
MSKLIVLFNLQEGADRTEYEAWAKSTDLPIVRELGSVSAFDVYKVDSLLGTDAAAPYEYVEVINVNDMELFGAEVATETMQRVAGEFRGFADNPVFMLTNNLD